MEETLLRPLRSGEFDRFYAILCESFPKNEFRSYEGQLGYFEKPNYTAYVVDGEGGIDALLTLWEYEGFCYIENFAVTPARRGSGLGAQMLAELGALTAKPVVLECELPETALASRRVHFYERCGFCRNAYPYIMPSLGEGRESMPLMIMSRPRALTAEEFKSMKKTLYHDVYGVDSSEI